MIFKRIKNFPGYYAGSDGNIYSDKRGTMHQLATTIQTTGKYYITNVIHKNKKKTSSRVHRLICETFHGKCPSKKHCASHLDGNWKNNKPENLTWETYSQNLARKKDHGTDDIGFKNSRALITQNQLRRIRILLRKKKLTHQQIAYKFKVSRVFITKIANGHRYKGQ